MASRALAYSSKTVTMFRCANSIKWRPSSKHNPVIAKNFWRDRNGFLYPYVKYDAYNMIHCPRPAPLLCIFGYRYYYSIMILTRVHTRTFYRQTSFGDSKKKYDVPFKPNIFVNGFSVLVYELFLKKITFLSFI